MNTPDKIYVSQLFAGQPGFIRWDSVAGAAGYSLERKINNEETFVLIYTGESTVFNGKIPLMAHSAQFRVQAYKSSIKTWSERDTEALTWAERDALSTPWISEYSGYTTSDVVPVIQVYLQSETLHAGYRVNINWTGISEDTVYILKRKTNYEADFTQVYKDKNNTFIDNVPENAQYITYQLNWQTFFDETWNEVTETFEVIPNRAPIISGADSDIGIRYKGFSITFNVYDPDPENMVNIRVSLNNNEIFNMPDITQHIDYTVNIPDATIFELQDLSVNTIIITATDNKGLSATRQSTFTVAEDLITTAIYYVMRDNIPVARLVNLTDLSWADHMEVGAHTYKIRAIDKYDNFIDSNEIVITTGIEHATLAFAESPDKYLKLMLQLNDRPQKNSRYSIPYDETEFEGREFPVYSIGKQRKKTHEFTFSTINQTQRDALFALIEAGKPLIYRDLYDTKMIGFIPDYNSDFMGHHDRHAEDDYSEIVNISASIYQSDYNEKVPYD